MSWYFIFIFSMQFSRNNSSGEWLFSKLCVKFTCKQTFWKSGSHLRDSDDEVSFAYEFAGIFLSTRMTVFQTLLIFAGIDDYLSSHQITKLFLLSNHYSDICYQVRPLRVFLFFLNIWQPPIFPYRHQYSIFGRLGLNHRVRDGNGCFS